MSQESFELGIARKISRSFWESSAFPANKMWSKQAPMFWKNPCVWRLEYRGKFSGRFLAFVSALPASVSSFRRVPVCDTEFHFKVRNGKFCAASALKVPSASRPAPNVFYVKIHPFLVLFGNFCCHPRLIRGWSGYLSNRKDHLRPGPD